MTVPPRKICVVTGTRAEYGLLSGLMREIRDDPDLILQLIATGAHLDTRFGHTVSTIETDGFEIAARVDLDLSGDSRLSTARSLGLAVEGMARAFAALSPDVVVILGDRYEVFGTAAAATVMNLPIAHIHGGELSHGAIDDAFRHAISKMAHLHFTSAAPYRDRVIQMGEAPDRVYDVGAIGLDNIFGLSMLDRGALTAAIGFDCTAPYFLLTFHPETVGDADPAAQIETVLEAFDVFTDHKLIITGVNADPGRDAIAARLVDYAARHADRVHLADSLGQLRYLSAMKHCAAVVGNSSSGIIEAPAMGVPTVNIGRRQDGRLRGVSIIDTPCRPSDIRAALRQAVDPNFRAVAARADTPYGRGGSAKRIVEVLKGVDLRHLSVKSFHDLPVAP